MTLIPQRVVRHRTCVQTAFTVVAGAAGWVDTDISALTGTNSTRIWIAASAPFGANRGGMRKHGDTNDTSLPMLMTQLASVDNLGHMDFYRGPAGDNVYVFIGYLSDG